MAEKDCSVDSGCQLNLECDKKNMVAELTGIIEDLCYQFSGWYGGGYSTNGLSALESAFAYLGWKEPHIVKSMQCDEPGCDKQASCGWLSPDGYRRTCSQHMD